MGPKDTEVWTQFFIAAATGSWKQYALGADDGSGSVSADNIAEAASAIATAMLGEWKCTMGTQWDKM